MIEGFVPLSKSIRNWPAFLGSANFLDDIGLRSYESQIEGKVLYYAGQVVYLKDIAFDFPLVENLQVAFLNSGTVTVLDFELELRPDLYLRLPNLNFSLLYQSNFLYPVEQVGQEWVRQMVGNQPKPVEVNFGGISLTLEGEDIDVDFTSTPTITIDTVQIGDSDIIVQLAGVTPYFSSKQTPPLGAPAGFRGVAIQDATVTFPAFWNYDETGSTGVIKGRSLVIGTGGFSGTLELEAKQGVSTTPLIEVQFGEGFAASLDTFSVTFLQNKIVGSTIRGGLKIPGFKDAAGNPADIDIDVYLGTGGDFSVTASEQNGLKEIIFGDVFSIRLDAVGIGRKDGDFFLEIGGAIKFLHPVIAGLLSDEIVVNKLLIWSDGSVEIEGGTLPLPDGVTLTLGPAKIALTALHFGSHQQMHNGIERKYRYFGFDGGLSLDPGGVDARGEGIKFYYSVDDAQVGQPAHRFLRIQSIAIDIVIPGNASSETATALIQGYLAIRDAGGSTEYSGSVNFQLPKARIAGGASMQYQPDEPAWIVDAHLELAAPIPLGTTGLGIYGFRGLIGQRYVATKPAAGLSEEDSWFDYYKAPPQEGVVVQKFETPGDTAEYDDPFSLGAGISLATTPDGGKAFSSKLFFLLSLPELILLEGKANVLGERVGLTSDDPPFFAYIAYEPGDSVEIGFGADYKIQNPNGRVLKLYAEVQAKFFFNNSKAWYVNFGTEQKRITSRVLSLFDATAYLMLSASGIRAGAGVEFAFDKNYLGGAIRASARVYIEVGGRISFERPQIGGFAMVGGHIDVYFLFFGFFLSLDTSLEVEAPKPFLIKGSVRLCVGVTIGFWKFKKRIEKCFTVEFTWEKSTQVDTSPVSPLDVSSLANKPPFAGVNILTGDTFDLYYFGTSEPSASHSGFTQTVIPLDTYIDIEFRKGLIANAIANKIGGVNNPPEQYIDLVPPKPVARQVEHEYRISELEIKAWNGSAWVDYQPYEALSTPSALSSLNANPAAYKSGFWQKTGNEYNKIRLLAQSPFNYMEAGQPGWYIPEQFGMTAASLFCEWPALEEECMRWQPSELGDTYPDGQWFDRGGILVRVVGGDGEVKNEANVFGILPSLCFPNDACVEIFFRDPCVKTSFKLSTTASGITVEYYGWAPKGSAHLYDLVSSEYISQGNTFTTISYNDPDEPIRKIRICPAQPAPQTLLNLQIQLDEVCRALNETPNLSTRDRNDMLAYKLSLEQQIESLEAIGCLPIATAAARTAAPGGKEEPAPIPEDPGPSEKERCVTCLYEVCCLTESAYEYNLLIPSQAAIASDFQDTIDGTNKILAPIWRPDTRYYIRMKVADTVNGGNPDEFEYYFGFRTAGPLGYFHEDSNANYIQNSGDDLYQYALTGLRAYIDYDRSYPNADGKLIGSKPLFYKDTKLRLFFLKRYVYHFLEGWPGYQGMDPLSGELQVVVKDPIEDITLLNPPPPNTSQTTIPVAGEEWNRDFRPYLPEDLQSLLDMATASGCVVTGGLSIAPASVFTTIGLNYLKPLKLYTAILNNLYEGDSREVHRFVFQTSRYGDFQEQVESFRLQDDDGNQRDAVFQVTVDVTNAEVDLAYNIIQGNPVGPSQILAETYPDPMERIWMGVFKASPFDPPISTEFNVIRQQSTNKVIAIWIRNPEPFNDPKIPANKLKRIIRVVNGTSVDNSYKALYSKDVSEAFIMNPQKNITASSLSFRFRYMEYDGVSYVATAQIYTGPIQL
ncbi:MAG: hypothetical protein AAGN35_16075 [Bacteroidota bacterium]